jgi:tetratricopeptide (TPR) repeat protein
MNKLKIYLLLTILLASLITACAKPASTLSAAELLDLGEKYLLEMNYEQAVVCFTKLIAIEPKNPRGYTGLAEAYVGLGEFDKALEILRQGLGQLPDNVEIAELLEELEASAGETGTANSATTPSSNTDVTIDVHLTAAQLAFLKLLEEALLAFDLEAAAPVLTSAEFQELCHSLPKSKDEYFTSGEYQYMMPFADGDRSAANELKYENVYKIDNHGIWMLSSSSVGAAWDQDGASWRIEPAQSAVIAVVDNLENGHHMSASGGGDSYFVNMEDITIVNGNWVDASRLDHGYIANGTVMSYEDYMEYQESQLNR